MVPLINMYVLKYFGVTSGFIIIIIIPNSVTAKDCALPAEISIHFIELKAETRVNSLASEQLGPRPRRPYSLRPITKT